MLSVVILTYNSSLYIQNCIKTLVDSFSKDRFYDYEIIVVDNNSKDDTVERVSSLKGRYAKRVKLIVNSRNFGFSKGNNIGARKASGDFLLFLNPDVMVQNIKFSVLLNFLSSRKKAGALTVKLLREDGSIDMACHRGMPDLWRSFCYLSGLERLARFSSFTARIFGGYHLLDKDLAKTHTVEAISGAFFLVKRKVFDQAGGFDEDYFMYAEDLDLCYRINKAGYRIYFYPRFKALHLKYKSGLGADSEKIRLKTRYHFWEAKKIFFQKNLAKRYSKIVGRIILMLLDLKLRKMRNAIGD